MSEFTLEDTGLNTEEVSGFDQSNVKRLRSGDGSFEIVNGKIILRDTDGNITFLADANG